MKNFPAEASSVDLDSATQKALAAVARACRQIEEDNDSLRQREANLREYEARLRAWQDEMDRRQAEPGTPTVSTSSPHENPGATRRSIDDSPLLTAWDKLQRAREILDAEQAHLVNDRLLLQEQAVAIHNRQAALQEREHEILEREAHLAATAIEEPPAGASRNPLGLARMLLRTKAG